MYPTGVRPSQSGQGTTTVQVTVSMHILPRSTDIWWSEYATYLPSVVPKTDHQYQEQSSYKWKELLHHKTKLKWVGEETLFSIMKQKLKWVWDGVLGNKSRTIGFQSKMSIRL